VELLAPRSTLNLEDQWTTHGLASTVWVVWLGWPYQDLRLPPA